MRKGDNFCTFHPAVTLGFFVIAIALAVLVRRPAFVAYGVAMAALYYLSVHGRAGFKMIAGLAVLSAVVTLVNPLVNVMGVTELFSVFGRPYTVEAVYYGASIAGMLACALLWFGGYNAVMTTDRFTYLFGAVVPAFSLVLTMVLRLVPNYQRKIKELSTARACVGMSTASGTRSERAAHGTALVSALASWALENGVVTADSMRSRGYGTGKRTSFAHYRFTARDGVFTVAMLVLLLLTIVALALGAGWVDFVPTFREGRTDFVFFAGLAASAALLALPTYVNVKEAISWRISTSSI